MLSNYAMREGEPHAVTFRFGGEERYEDLLQLARWNARASVSDLNGSSGFAIGRVVRAYSNKDRTFGTLFGNCFGCVSQKVEDCLSQHPFVCRHYQIICGVKRDLHLQLRKQWLQFRNALV